MRTTTSGDSALPSQAAIFTLPVAPTVSCRHSLPSITMVTTTRQQRRRRLSDSHFLKHIRALAVLLLPVAIVVTALHVSCAYTLLYMCQVVVALGGLELSWWHFRIRKRLLIPMLCEYEHLSGDEYERLQCDEMNPDTCAVSPIADRWLGGRNWIAALIVSALIGGGVVGIVIACQGVIVDVERSTLGWRMVLSCAALGTTLSTLCACFAPTARDGVAMLVYQACFTVSSLNTFLAHYDRWVDDPELLDSLYVILVGVCLIVVWRIVSSKEVLETTLSITFDIFGLVFLTSPMMETADFVDHPHARKLGDKISTFWLVICAAEVGHYLFMNLRTHFPRVFQRCRQIPLTKSIAASHGVEDMVVSTTFGLMGVLISWFAFPDHHFESWEVVILITAVVLSQMSRLGIDTMRAMAKVNGTANLKEAKHSYWNLGVMKLVSPYLVAAIVFHPYIKSLLNSSGSVRTST